jgi:hypothetical protein
VLHPFEEQVGEQERGEVVEREGALVAVLGDVAGVPEAPDIVDQHIDLGQALQDLLGQAAQL